MYRAFLKNPPRQLWQTIAAQLPENHYHTRIHYNHLEPFLSPGKKDSNPRACQGGFGGGPLPSPNH
jgi:hypothetical protein